MQIDFTDKSCTALLKSDLLLLRSPNSQFLVSGFTVEQSVVFHGRVHGPLEPLARHARHSPSTRDWIQGTRPDAPTGHNTYVPYSSTLILECQSFSDFDNHSLAAGTQNHHVQFIATSLIRFACSICGWQARCPQHPRRSCLPRALSRDRGKQDASRCRQQSSS